MEDLTVEEVAKELNMHPESVRRLLRDNKIEGYQPGGGAWRVTRADLDAFKKRGGNRRVIKSAKVTTE